MTDSGGLLGARRRPGRAAASALADFGSVWGAGLPDFAAPVLSAVATDPIEDLRRAAYEEGFAKGQAAAAGKEALRLAMVETEAVEALAAARAEWAASIADRLGGALDAALVRVEATLSTHVAAILEPFVEQAMKARMMEAFAEAVRQATGKTGRRSAPPITIEMAGPADLLDALRARLSDADFPVTFVASAGPDIVAAIDDTLLSTDVAAWLSPFRTTP